MAVIDTPSFRVVRTLSVSGKPEGIGVDPTQNRVFVALTARHSVVALDGASYAILATIPVGEHPVHPLRVDAPHHRVYVVSSGSSTLSVIDSRSLSVVQTIPTGANPEGLDIAPRLHRAYVSDEGDPGTDKNSGHTVSIVDLRAGRVIDTVQVLLGPDGVTYDAAVNRLYVCDESPHMISVILLGR